MLGRICKQGCGSDPVRTVPNAVAAPARARVGERRRLLVAILGVWALIIQALLPVAGAMASPGGDDFWGALCSSAGIERSSSAFTPVLDEERSSPDGMGCGACVTCACSTTNGCGCGALRLVEWQRVEPTPRRIPQVENATGVLFDRQQAPRGPPLT